jgi:hypothetical protein
MSLELRLYGFLGAMELLLLSVGVSWGYGAVALSDGCLPAVRMWERHRLGASPFGNFSRFPPLGFGPETKHRDPAKGFQSIPGFQLSFGNDRDRPKIRQPLLHLAPFLWRDVQIAENVRACGDQLDEDQK